MTDKYEIDVQEFAKQLQAGKHLNGKDGLLTPPGQPHERFLTKDTSKIGWRDAI